MHSQTEAVAIVFVRDTQNADHADSELMRKVFGFTEAEADLAQTVQAGLPLERYARKRGVSLNTVYTHLRRLKAKTGTHQMTELSRKLNDLRLPLRLK
jgi:DNA-binding CsgD family transcriptional regulator